MFGVTGLKILGRVGTYIFFLLFFFGGKKYNIMHFKREKKHNTHKQNWALKTSHYNRHAAVLDWGSKGLLVLSKTLYPLLRTG